jgi:DNA-binding response OmpR family regulator
VARHDFECFAPPRVRKKAPPQCAPAEERRAGMAKVLVVDDDPDVVEACKLYLEKEGHRVGCAYNRAEAMKAVKEGKPELIVLDVMMEMPDDGLAMAQELRRNGVMVPIVMLTSIAKVTGMEYGKDKELVPVEAFLEKPVAPKTLCDKVASLLSAKKKK